MDHVRVPYEPARRGQQGWRGDAAEAQREQPAGREQLRGDTLDGGGPGVAEALAQGQQARLVAACPQPPGQVERHPYRPAEGVRGGVQRDGVQDSHVGSPTGRRCPSIVCRVSAGRFLWTTDPAPATAQRPTVTPASTVARTATHAPSSTAIGALR